MAPFHGSPKCGCSDQLSTPSGPLTLLVVGNLHSLGKLKPQSCFDYRERQLQNKTLLEQLLNKGRVLPFFSRTAFLKSELPKDGWK